MTQRSIRSKEEVAGILKSILVADKKSSTIGMPIVQLDEEYKSQDGTRIPYRALGYACLMDFLESLQRNGEIIIGKRNSMNVVYLCVDEKIAHVSALVAGQKDSSRRCSRGGKRFTCRTDRRTHYLPPARLDSKTLAEVLKLIKSAPNGMHVSRVIEYLQDRNTLNIDENRLIRQLRDVDHEVSVQNGMIYPIMSTKNPPLNNQPKNVNSAHGYAGKNIQEPEYRPAGSSDGEDDYAGFEFCTKRDNSQPPKSRNPDELSNRAEAPAAASNFEKTANDDLEKNGNCDENNDNIGMLVNSRTKFRLEKLIQKHPNGIWCAELPNFYHQEYCIPLNLEDLGFGNVSDFAANLPDIFHCVRLQENGDFKLFDAKAPKPETRENPRPEHLSLAALHNIYESYYDEVEPVPVLLSPTMVQRLVPEGVMTIGETVAQIYVTQLFSDNTSLINVVVVDVNTPTFFWIQLLKKIQKFERFMKDLHEFYSQHASKYVIPIVVLERGLNCACIFDNKWHRGVIKAVKPNGTVTVLFYDYGTVVTYPPEAIHFLHRSFSSLPAQAIPCGLYNVKPISTEKWPHSVCQVFSEKVQDVPMVAMLGSIDADNNSMLIALTNTEGLVDFHISDWMISSGFAMHGKMGETVDLNETCDDSAKGGSPGTSPRFATIDESIDTSDSSSRIAAQSPQIVEVCEIQLAKIRQALEVQFNVILKQLHSTFEAYASKFSQLAAEPKPGQCGDSKMLDHLLNNMSTDLLNNMSIDLRSGQQSVNTEPPPLPPRPSKSYTRISGSHELRNSPKIRGPNGNDNSQENLPTDFQMRDFNMNVAQNPFDYSKANTLTPPLLNFDYQLPFKNDNRANSGTWNGCVNSEARQAFAAIPQQIFTPESPDFVPQEPVNVALQDPAILHAALPNFCTTQRDNLAINSQEMRAIDPVSLVTPRQTFEMSLQESAKNFFARLDAKLKANNQETNPFKVAIESEKFEEQSPSPSLPKNLVINPFALDVDANQGDKISSTRIVHPQGPVDYDFTGINKKHRNLEAATTYSESEREKLEMTKLMNVASWITQGDNSKRNYGNKDNHQVSEGKQPFDSSFTGNFPRRTANPNVSGDVRTSNVFTSTPVTPGASLTESQISREAFKAPIADPHDISAPGANYVESEFLRAANGGMEFISKESPENGERYEEKNPRNIAAGSPLMIEIKPEERLTREETDSRNLPVKQEAEVRSAEKTWFFREIRLTKQSVHLINLDNEGWLTVEEFMTAFTTYKMTDIMLQILARQNAHIPFRFIERVNYPALFEQLERTSLGVPRNHKNEIGDVLHLAPLKSLLKLLRKLKIVDLKEVELAAKKKMFPQRNPALYDACTIIAIYPNTQRNIE